MAQLPDRINDQLNKTMTRKQFLQMSGALLLAVLGVQNLVAIFTRHTSNPGATGSLLTPSSNGFGSRKFGA